MPLPAGFPVPEKYGGFQRVRNVFVPRIHLTAQDALLALVPKNAGAFHQQFDPVHFRPADLVHLAGNILDFAGLAENVLFQRTEAVILLRG